jgi:DNA-binding transcriptional ArsR family regulator
VLREAELVTEQRSGRERYYSLHPGPLVELLDWLHPYEKFWRERVRALRNVLEEVEEA